MHRAGSRPPSVWVSRALKQLTHSLNSFTACASDCCWHERVRHWRIAWERRGGGLKSIHVVHVHFTSLQSRATAIRKCHFREGINRWNYSSGPFTTLICYTLHYITYIEFYFCNISCITLPYSLCQGTIVPVQPVQLANTGWSKDHSFPLVPFFHPEFCNEF